MRDLFSRYVLRFNARYERKGHLFGGTYRQAVCLDEGYLIAASLYIHNNPVKAGLCESAPDYPWSSVQRYCNDAPDKSFACPEFILDLLGGARDGQTVYRQMINKSHEIDIGTTFEKPDALDRFRKSPAEMFPRIFQSVRKSKKVTDAVLLDPEPA